jgi:hypothetical protein
MGREKLVASATFYIAVKHKPLYPLVEYLDRAGKQRFSGAIRQEREGIQPLLFADSKVQRFKDLNFLRQSVT